MSKQATLQQSLTTALATQLGAPAEVQTLRLIPGGASQETWLVDLTVAVGPLAGAHRLVLRRPLGGKIYADSLDLPAEHAVLCAVYAAGVPAPEPFVLLPEVAGAPALLMARLDGETIGRRLVKEPAFAPARALLPAQMGAALAAIHAVAPDQPALSGLPAPPLGISPAQASIARLEADLDNIGEPHPASELALRWLRRNEPPSPDLALIHGDYRIGNVVVGAQGLVGVLDWEFAHLGDPAEDLAWPLMRDWRFGADELRFGGVGDPEAFFAAYEAAGGRAIDRRRVFYWEVMSNVKWAVGALNQARRHLSGEARNLEFASLGRRAAEMELEALMLLVGA